MKVFLFFCFLIAFGWLGTYTKSSSATVAGGRALIAKDSIDFVKQVQPIMVKNCSPCHFPGGKMYDRLPFDKDTTILNHSAGILR